MPTPRHSVIFTGVAVLGLAQSCLLDRGGAFELDEPGPTGSGAGAPACSGPADCEPSTTCKPSRCEDGRCSDEVAPAGTACTEDGGDMCDGAGKCVRKDGSDCTSGPQCQSGYCSDGVCCDAVCDGPCKSCILVGELGSCTPLAAGANECADGVCDGSGQCAAGGPLGQSLRFGDGYDDRGTAVALDELGNRYLSIAFVGDITLSTTHSGSTLSSDIAVARITPSGTVSWSRHFGGPGNDSAIAIAVDESGHTFVGGSFEQTLGIGSTVHTSLGMHDMFVAKLDAAGNRIWSRSFGGVYWDGLAELELDVDGNVVFAATVGSAVSFDEGMTTVPFAGTYDVVAVKLAGDDGALVWAKSFGGTNWDEARGLAIDDGGGVLLTGLFRGTASFGSTMLTATDGDGFLLRLDAGGAPAWVEALSGSGEVVGRALHAVGQDAIVAGDYGGTLTLGQIDLAAGAGSTDVFVARYSDRGELRWARSFNGALGQEAHEAASDPWGNVVIVGSSAGTADFAGLPLGTAGGTDAYVVKLASDGTGLWARAFGDGLDQSVDGVVIGEDGAITATGWFAGTIDFGDGSPHTSAGLGDVFLMTRAP